MSLDRSSQSQPAAADLDYSLTFADWVTGAEQIATATWSATPNGLTLHNQAIDGTGLIATCFVSGGAAGTAYAISLTIVTTASPPRTTVETFTLTIF